MPTRMTFAFFGEDQLDRTLERIERDVADVRPAWDAIADDFAQVEHAQFATQGTSGSGGWAHLSPAYAAWKAEHYPGKPILQRTGDLAHSLTTRPFGVEHITADSMVIGSDVDYGRYHQHGTPKMPRRRPVDLTEGQRRDWVKVLQRFILTGEL